MSFFYRSRRASVDGCHRHVRPTLESLENRIVPAGPAVSAPILNALSPQQIVAAGAAWANSMLASNQGTNVDGRLATDVGVMVTAANQALNWYTLEGVSLIGVAAGYATHNQIQVEASSATASDCSALGQFYLAGFSVAWSEFVADFSSLFSHPPLPALNGPLPYGGFGFNPNSPFGPPGLGGLGGFGGGFGGGLDGGFGGGLGGPGGGFGLGGVGGG
jgi:hypothetical protein